MVFVSRFLAWLWRAVGNVSTAQWLFLLLPATFITAMWAEISMSFDNNPLRVFSLATFVFLALIIIFLLTVLYRDHAPVSHPSIRGTFSVSGFQETGHPIHGRLWSNLHDLSDALVRQAPEIIPTHALNELLPLCAKKIAAHAQLHGILPHMKNSTLLSPLVLERGIFRVNGGQMDIADQSGQYIARFIHIKTKEAKRAAIAALEDVKSESPIRN